VLGFDVGGSSIKAGLIETQGGAILQKWADRATPQPATPELIAKVLAAALAGVTPAPRAVGVALPTVIKAGRARTAANIDATWLGAPIVSMLRDAFGMPCTCLNDADAAGIAEMRYGAGRGRRGHVLVLTLGTGIGSAIFIDGQLLPNTELGHLRLAEHADAERWASAAARTREQLSFEQWALRLNAYLAEVQRLLWPDVIILGGAVSEHFEQFARLLRADAEILPARLRGDAGFIGAAAATVS
jgi:polyphosphate glucokinase